MYKNTTPDGHTYERHNVALKPHVMEKVEEIKILGIYSADSYGLLVSEMIADLYRRLQTDGYIPKRTIPDAERS